MDQSYVMDPLDHKQPTMPQMRRVYYGDDHELLRQLNAIDLKYPFPQAHLYPPSLLVRAAPVNTYGNMPPGGVPGVQEVHMDDPRYVPQDLMLLVRDMDDKRLKGYYGYPLAAGSMPVGPHGNAGVLNNALLAPPVPPPVPRKKEEHGLVLPIPPLHVQQQLVNDEDKSIKAETENVILSKCLRCKKDFVQRLIVAKDLRLGKVSAEPKVFKLCHHCRDLQRQRLRRWQKKTKDKQGACRRCGNEIPPEEQKYVLCPMCRQNLRIRKANRAAQGKCVHCLGPINVLIINDDAEDPLGRRSSNPGSYKVCQRCRENDKIRRTNLERMGNCNRCAKALSPSEQGKHKVCLSCRQKKKKLGSVLSYSGGTAHDQGMGQQMDVGQNVLVPPLNFIPAEQAAMMMSQGGVNQGPVPNVGAVQVPPQEYAVPYGQYKHILQAPEMYKTQIGQLPQVQPQGDQQNPLPQFHALQHRSHYTRDRM